MSQDRRWFSCRVLHVPMAQDSEGPIAINKVCLLTADMVRLDQQTPVDCMHHTILVVDDDRPIRNLCRLTLEESGYLVSEASNGKNALAAIEETDFDLIVLDLAMPDMDGFEFLKGVRAKSPKPKILVISGFLGGHDAGGGETVRCGGKPRQAIFSRFR